MGAESKPVDAGSSAQPPAASSSYPAYVYPPPPHYGGPPPPYPPHYYYHSNPNPYDDGGAYALATLLRRLIISFLLAFLIVTIIGWLFFTPLVPTFAITSAAADLPASSPSMNLNLTLSVRNPNKKMGVYYDDVEATVLYKDDTVSVATVPALFQERESSGEVPVSFAAGAVHLNGDVAKAMQGERASGGAVELSLRLLLWVWFEDGSWRTSRHTLRVFCDGFRVGFPSATAAVGSLKGGPKQCLAVL